MSEAVKLFRAKIKELAAFVESNEAESYLTGEFIDRLIELRELTDIIKIDLANQRKGEIPVFGPKEVYVPVVPEENLAPLVVETPVETPKAKVEKKPEPVVEEVKEVVVEKSDGEHNTDKEPSDEVVGDVPAKTGKAKPAKG